MSLFRQLACRGSLLVITLAVINIISFMLLFVSHREQEMLRHNSTKDNHVLQQNTRGAQSLLTPAKTVTFTSMVTATSTVTTTATAATTTLARVEPPSPAVKPPGPAFCDECSSEDSLCMLYGKHNLARSRAYEGANARFHRVIANALAGKPTKIGILGGSVTKGHGLRHGNVENWANRFREAWRGLFPNSETTLINGAVPATGSSYLSMCFGEHIDEDVDLVIVELLINDQRIESDALAYEWLLRGILDLPKSPAVINLQTIGLSFALITTGGDLHTPVSEYYDTPIISVRNMLAPHILKHADLDEHYFTQLANGKPDWRHVNAHGHAVMSDLLVAYTQRQICAVEREHAAPTTYSSDGTLHGTDGLDTIPRLRLFQKYDRETVTGPIKPMCHSLRTTKHRLSPIVNRGWREWAHESHPDKPYLIANQPGATVKFNVETGLLGRVRITHLQSKIFGLGDAWCWLDDDRERGKRVVSWWKIENINVAMVATITETATPGKHILTCEIMQETSDPGGGREFRLIAVDAA